MKKLLYQIEKSYYESKPILIIGIAILVLVGTSWGISTLITALMILGWAATILFWRLEFRGSLRYLWGARTQQPARIPTPPLNSNNDRSNRLN